MASKDYEGLQRDRKLSVLSTTFHALDTKLRKTLDSIDSSVPKWQWPQSALAEVKEIGLRAEIEHGFIRRTLDELLAWPDERSADPTLFYNGNYDTFTRAENWFSTMGFAKYQTMYTFTETWDRIPISATFLVPESIQAGAKAPIVWFFHGGGLCTGANDHIPWYSQTTLEFARKHQAIIIAPDYPLGPEGRYVDICSAVRDFLRWYKEDGYFKRNDSDADMHWTGWLLAEIGLKDVEIDTGTVYVEGESAGAAVAVTALWENAHKLTGTNLPIKAALLQYPMIKHYKRDFPPNDAPLVYMGKEITHAQVEKQAGAVHDEIMKLEGAGMLPMRMKGYAPEYMAAAFLLSTTKMWQPLFKRPFADLGHFDHGPPTKDVCDSLERADLLSEHVHHDSLPPILMYHGYDDENCPLRNTMKFRDMLVQRYPSRYVDGQTVLLWEVTELNGRRVLNDRSEIERLHSEQVGHGFDYDLEMEREPFLKEVYGQIQHFWLGK